MSANDAVAKAKAIAAKLSGAATSSSVNALDVANAAEAALAAAGIQTSSADDSGKRKRWADGPSDEGDPSKKAKTYEAEKRLWISTDQKPASHYRLYWGLHGESITRQVSAGEIGLILQGRGSSTTPALPGIPESPLHLLIQGPSVEACENVVPLLEELFVKKADQAETMVDESESQANAVQSGTATGSGGYRPAPVAALIHNNGMPVHDSSTLLEEQIGVPNSIVGFIIGRGGESISSMQLKTGCKVQIQREADMAPGATQRVITLQAPTKESIDQCRAIIEGMVSERVRTTSREITPSSQTQEARLQEAIQSGHVLVTVQVPDTDVGLIIGKSGTTIKGIQDRSGANIQIPQSGDADNPSVRTVSITHPHSEGANLAKQLIEDILSTKRDQSPHITMQIEIPDKDVGMCIGRQGCVIREMQNQTNTKIQIPSFSTPGQQMRIATVVGPSDGCNRVKQMIQRIILEQSSQSVMSGQGYDQYNQGYGGGGGYGQYGGGQYGSGYGQQQGGYDAYGQQQGGYAHHGIGNQDYSKEWAAYYAAQSAQGGDATAPTAAAPAALSGTEGQQGADSYFEQFFRYAYYYGEEAARTYYGAWSPPPGTPNPYGVNPSGITPAPAGDDTASSAAGPGSAPASDTAVPAHTNVRDSGRRGVSNLPAWMTKQNQG